MKLFGTSGIRRIADRDLIELAFKVGMAVARHYKSVVVGRDTRTSGDAVKHAFISGVLTAGAKCCDAGILPTPSLALKTGEFQAGAMITASHNPPEYNGIKLINPGGSAFDAGQQEQIEKLVSKDAFIAEHWDELGSSVTDEEAVEEHIEHILKNTPDKLKLKVVLDCGCGAGSVITPELLKRLGCEVTAINSYPTGFFPRAVEPTEDNLQDLIQATKELGADLGIAHDGDADRMMAVDDKGRFISGDKLLALFARQADAKKVVTTIDASMVIDEMGFDVIRTPVGDTYVSDELKRDGDFGGEPSGSWVFPENSLCPDGIFAAARIAVIAGKQKLSELVDNIPQYPIIRGSVTGGTIVESELESKLKALEPVSMNTIDGIKLNFKDAWLLIRASGTEPKTRITAEAKDEMRLKELYEAGVGIINEHIKEIGEK
ncbi:phosphoglucosamine mutase [Chloroflexota bacterium]